jgi:hypothetical protein
MTDASFCCYGGCRVWKGEDEEEKNRKGMEGRLVLEIITWDIFG